MTTDPTKLNHAVSIGLLDYYTRITPWLNDAEGIYGVILKSLAPEIPYLLSTLDQNDEMRVVLEDCILETAERIKAEREIGPGPLEVRLGDRHKID